MGPHIYSASPASSRPEMQASPVTIIHQLHATCQSNITRFRFLSARVSLSGQCIALPYADHGDVHFSGSLRWSQSCDVIAGE